MIHRTFAPLATLSLLVLALGTVGCSNGSSPTEPAVSSFDSSSAAVSSTGDKRHGADDPAGDDNGGLRGGHGADDPAGDDRGGRRGGRGADDPAGDDNGGRRGGRNRPARGAEFSGVVSSVDGQTLNLANGARIVVNGQTVWNARGDLKSLDQVATAVAAGRRTRVEGRGTRQADGTFVAQSIKAETGR